MDLWPPHQYREQAAELGRASATIEASVEQAHAVQERGLPAILSLGHLAWHTDVPYTFLRSVVERSVNPYRLFQINKRSGGRRRICVAEPRLRRVMRWLNKFVLTSVPPHAASHAYAPGCSIRKCAQMHLGSRWLIKMDIQHFFESISEVQVYRVFSRAGYEPLVSFELARLTTRLPASRRRYSHPNWRNWDQSRHANIPWYQHPYLGSLPQGAPTSPAIANLAVREFDKSIAALAKSNGLIYTRYSDDLIFSTAEHTYSRAQATRLINAVYGKMREVGLRPHTAKTVVVPPGARKVVLGLLVDGTQVRLSREFRARIECHVHYASRFGPQEHSQRRGFRSVFGFEQHLRGLINFARSVDEEFAGPLEHEMAKIPWPR